MFHPNRDLNLVKTKHLRLEVAKVVAGMSGSPIYLDNKMIGAYAYGWSFGRNRRRRHAHRQHDRRPAAAAAG